MHDESDCACVQRYYLSGFPNFLWFFTMMAALSSLRAMTGRTRRQTETDVNRDVRYFFQRVGPPPRLSVVRMVEEGSHAQRGNIRSGDHITSAAPQEKEGAKNNRFLLSNNKALFPFSSLSPSPGIRTRSIVAVQWGGACLPHKDQ